VKPLSLKMRAIGLLSQREHSPLELRRKLLRIARDVQVRARAAERSDPAGGDAGETRDDDEISSEATAAEVDALLAWLQAQGYLSESRFVESRVHARAQRYGSLRIKQELAQHGLDLGAEQQAALAVTEFERAQAIWQRKFGNAPAQAAFDPALRARQTRFLAARGFSPGVIRRVLRAEDD